MPTARRTTPEEILMPLLLDPNPPTIQPLLTPDSERLGQLYPDLPQTPAKCKTCRGKGTFRWLGPDGEPTEYFCGSDPADPTCVEQFLLHRSLLHAGIGLAYQRLAWTDATGVGNAALTEVFDYLDDSDHLINSGIGLFLTGSPGTGKTMIASLLLKKLVAHGQRCFFTTFHTLLDYFTAGWTSTEEKAWFDKRVRNAGVLVIDDIGREHKGRIDVAVSTLDHVLRSRVASARPTIVTTNLALDELAEIYTRNAASLLTEGAIPITFAGEDYRPTQQGNVVAEAKRGLTRPIVIA